MTTTTTTEELRSELETRELELRTFVAGIATEHRDATDSELWFKTDKETELTELRAKLARLEVEQRAADERAERERIVEESRNRSAELSAGYVNRDRDVPTFLSRFAELEERAAHGDGGRMRIELGLLPAFELEMRSTTTANAGAAHVTPAPSAGRGIWLPLESGARNMNAQPGTRIEAGVWADNTPVPPTAEGTGKPVLDPTSLATSIVAPYAVASNVTLQSQLSGEGLAQFVWAGERKVRRSVNDAFVAAMVAAAGTAGAFDTDVATSVDGAIAASMADNAAVPALVIVDAAHFSGLISGAGNDSRDAQPAYRGITLVPSTASALAGNALVVHGDALAMSLSAIEVRTQPQVMTNSVDAVVEAWFGIAARGASGLTLQDLTAATAARRSSSK